MGTVLQDLRYGLRMLAKNPGFTAVAVLSLALGIGVNAAILSVVNGVLIHPLPYEQPERLVHVTWLFPNDEPVESVSGTEYLYWKEHNQVFESTAAHDILSSGLNVLAGSEPEYVKGVSVTDGFFHVLGVAPFLGRGFVPAEARPGGPRVAVLSHSLWQSRFGADPGVLGKRLTINGEDYTVVGIMPRGFSFTPEADIWLPLQLAIGPQDQQHNYEMIARLRSGVTLEKAQADVEKIFGEFQHDFPKIPVPGERGMILRSYQTWLVGDLRTSLLVLLGAVGFVLLIASANVANLLLSRAVAREREIAVRAALGASGSRLMRQLGTESVLLGLLGGLLGLLVGQWVLHALLAMTPGAMLLRPFTPPVSSFAGIGLNGGVVLFSLLVSAIVGLGVGLAPWLSVSKIDLNQSLKEGGRASPSSFRGRLRDVLVATEVALSVVLLVGAGLLIRSFLRLSAVKLGFDPRQLLAMQVSLASPKYRSTRETWGFERQIVERLKALPGAIDAAVATSLPFEPTLDLWFYAGEKTPKNYCEVLYQGVSPGYFRTLGLPVLRGRPLLESDSASSTSVALINETLARRYWPDRSPIGDRLLGGEEHPREIVGVVADTKELGLDQPSVPMVFVPVAQMADDFTVTANHAFLTAFVVKSRVPVEMVTLQQALQQIDPQQPVANLRHMTEVVGATIAPQRFRLVLMGSFAGLALLLAAVGIYGVISYFVTARIHEIGIRMALGAGRGDVLKMVVGQGLLLTAVGVAVGLLGSLALTRFLESLLYGVRPTDAATFVAVSLALTSVALLASYIPARRATKVDPIVALRYE